MLSKAARLAINKRRTKAAEVEFYRRKKVLNDYLTSDRVKRMQKSVDDALAAVNVLIEEWNDIILEDLNRRSRQ